MNRINVALYGFGDVGKKLFNLIREDNRIKIVRIVNTSSNIEFSKDKPDLILDAVKDVNFSKDLISKSIVDKINIITCSKALIHAFGDNLFTLAEKNNVTIYLNSIVAGDNGLEFPDKLTHKNFNEYLHNKPFIFRGAGGQETATVMYNDILKYIEDRGIL